MKWYAVKPEKLQNNDKVAVIMSQVKKNRRKKKLVGNAERPRLVVYRSLRYIYGQIVDDTAQKTILSVSNLNKDVRDEIKDMNSKTEVSKKIGEILARRAREKKIKKVVFDRNGYKYHGRVKALAEGAREGGLEF